jgi:predicted metal-dependent hydrolase
VTDLPPALPASITAAGLEFAVKPSEKRRTIGITVDRDGALIMHAPAGCDEHTLLAFAHDKRMWIYSKLAEKDLLLSPRPTKQFVSGEGFSYLGRSHRLKLIDSSGPGVRLERGRFLVPADRVNAGQGADIMIDWYRSRALRWLSGRIPGWAERMGVVPGAIDVRELGYRWGSLGKDSRVNFHWATIQLSPRLVDYVIVHELAHIDEPHHTPAFWGAVARAMPSFQVEKGDLARIGARLWLGDTEPALGEDGG